MKNDSSSSWRIPSIGFYSPYNETMHRRFIWQQRRLIKASKVDIRKEFLRNTVVMGLEAREFPIEELLNRLLVGEIVRGSHQSEEGAIGLNGA